MSGPLRERLRARLLVALYGACRQAEAARLFREVGDAGVDVLWAVVEVVEPGLG